MGIISPLTLLISPSSITALLIFLNSSYNASTSLTLTARTNEQTTTPNATCAAKQKGNTINFSSSETIDTQVHCTSKRERERTYRRSPWRGFRDPRAPWAAWGRGRSTWVARRRAASPPPDTATWYAYSLTHLPATTNHASAAAAAAAARLRDG